MIIKIKRAAAEQAGLKKFEAWGLNKDAWCWKGHAELNLGLMRRSEIEALRDLLAENQGVRGFGILLSDVRAWLSAMSDASAQRPRTVQQFYSMVHKYLSKVPGHRVYERFGESLWLPGYVYKVRYHPEDKGRNGYTPACVELCFAWEEFGGYKTKTVWFEASDLSGRTVGESLMAAGLIPENQEMREAHLKEVQRFGEIHSQIGKQFLAVGTATNDCDGNKEDRHESWYWRDTKTLDLMRGGSPTRMVVDVFNESGEDDSDKRRSERNEREIDRNFWERQDNDGGDSDELSEGTDMAEVPIRPFLCMFDLSKHLRLRVHVSYLTEYKYDPNLADKLVLKPELKSLVKILIEHKDSGFTDIVKGKSGGAVVLLAGPPGVGKTLTAEVFAESEGRALYSVQCSQLGTDPDKLEEELLKVFARARRWNAVMLLDEADVYVRERATDLAQNAIVGVFLRVLEYQQSVLFLTTNRPDDIDDAIASRCIARLNYTNPGVADQARIWRILADGASVKITDAVIAEVTKANPDLSGRDVKQLLKLSMLMDADKPISAKTVEFVKQFRPAKVK